MFYFTRTSTFTKRHQMQNTQINKQMLIGDEKNNNLNIKFE